MIIVKLKGGLGNQMFQYALGLKLSILNKDKVGLDTTSLQYLNHKEGQFRPFDLKHFNIRFGVAKTEDIKNLQYPFGFFSKIREKISHKIFKKYYIGWYPELLEQKGDLYLDGYFQSEKYFKDIRDILLEDFTLKEPLEKKSPSLLEHMKNTESVSLHVRRGDYVTDHNTAWLGTCSLEYYTNAYNTIRDKTDKELVVFLFSDDPDWVQEHIKLPTEMIAVSKKENLKDYEELVAMSKCKHNIIANSSFSWWGTWLNTNPDKIVIAPTPWTNKHHSLHNDIIPKSWIQLPKN